MQKDTQVESRIPIQDHDTIKLELNTQGNSLRVSNELSLKYILTVRFRSIPENSIIF
jgi:hypothetical protein